MKTTAGFIDSESRTVLRLMRERAILREALSAIQEKLDDPAHGAHGSDLHGDIQALINIAQRQWERK